MIKKINNYINNNTQPRRGNGARADKSAQRVSARFIIVWIKYLFAQFFDTPYTLIRFATSSSYLHILHCERARTHTPPPTRLTPPCICTQTSNSLFDGVVVCIAATTIYLLLFSLRRASSRQSCELMLRSQHVCMCVIVPTAQLRGLQMNNFLLLLYANDTKKKTKITSN